MSVEENKKTLVRWHEEIAFSGSIEEFDEILADEYHNWQNGSDKQGMKNGLPPYSREHPTLKVKVDEVIGEGNTVATRVSYFEEGKKTGEGISFYRLVDGKIVDDWNCVRLLNEA